MAAWVVHFPVDAPEIRVTLAHSRMLALAPGEPVPAHVSTWALLESVTFRAFGGPATITTADATSTLHDGELVTWSVAKSVDSALVGPLEVAVTAGGTGTVAVAWTRAVNALAPPTVASNFDQ
ncbi:hypothetical protein ABZ890_42505 [Streptomyces sp. NPDC046984]|uniref:hypothetical protein n=1 Tax=Streptomyces sp. NPDC046984 TaxID=3155138 RepID=UPI0033C80D42